MTSQNDCWNDLTDEQKQGMESSLSDINSGRVIQNEIVKNALFIPLFFLFFGQYRL